MVLYVLAVVAGLVIIWFYEPKDDSKVRFKVYLQKKPSFKVILVSRARARVCVCVFYQMYFAVKKR